MIILYRRLSGEAQPLQRRLQVHNVAPPATVTTPVNLEGVFAYNDESTAADRGGEGSRQPTFSCQSGRPSAFFRTPYSPIFLRTAPAANLGARRSPSRVYGYRALQNSSVLRKVVTI